MPSDAKVQCGKFPFKRSAFDLSHCNRLCRWRHLLRL